MRTKTRVLTEEQREAMEARRARFRDLIRRVADMPEHERADLARKAAGVVTVEGRRLSEVNSILCLLQRPGVSVVGGFRQWLKAGRAVRKGERGMMIWVPKVPKQGEGEEGPADEEAREVSFFAGTVFDISQTQEVETA